MTFIVTPSQMRAIDQDTIQNDVDRGFYYMGCAAKALFEEVHHLCGIHGWRHITIFCGTGNNGGDGVYLAWLLRRAGYAVLPLCLGTVRTAEGAAAVRLYEKTYGKIDILSHTEDLSQLPPTDVYIEALLGTGAVGPVRGRVAPCVAHMNRSNRPVIAVDSPAGVDAATAEVYPGALQASWTLSLGFPRVGHYFTDTSVLGRCICRVLPYPKEIVQRHGDSVYLLDENRVTAAIPRRQDRGSKYDHGVLFSFTGSPGMTGAAVLSARAAFRSGCGMVYAALPEDSFSAMTFGCMETVCIPRVLPVTTWKNEEPLATALRRSTARLVGCGLSRDPRIAEEIRTFCSLYPTQLVLDADGLTAFAGHDELLRQLDTPILTPHAGEWQRLFGPLPPYGTEWISRVSHVAQSYGCVLVLKGMPTLIGAPTGEVFLSTYGNSALATAGTGDVLAGCIAAFRAQGCNSLNAALAGVALHGRGAELFADEQGEHALRASDLPSYIGRAIHHTLSGTSDPASPLP
ncbi:NAD(P)H-hydrate dehydratase [Chitinivibrio alkaliphilus]|uniref:ADP-dependent (S)-NAD(P)H-hydrate dehydratase n=1 Tax=Chitinivibrio alkaliphilus ACht1 TaxID=1313304 RepID=U7D9M4_9BACT|nr:NAD(P)H-hydrate dehydratase [Chitinivibrio alkaliphilus]ERP31115.1 carbohydrate kinase, YjeF related protein [Chitinivibrio alkaliphilus ACht1]